MTLIEYLNLMKDKKKEKSIGLYLNRKILDAFEDDSFNDHQETTEERNSDDYDEEEEEEEESEDVLE